METLSSLLHLTHPSLSKAVKHASIFRNFESSTKVLLVMLFVCRIVAMSVLGDAKCGPTVSTELNTKYTHHQVNY